MRIGLELGLTRTPAVRRATGLDALSVPAAAAFALIRLRAGYAGSALRVRRSSDNAETDIPFAAASGGSGVGASVDFGPGGAIAAFCGTSTGSQGYVTRWYDQSGNGSDLVQPMAARQPQIWRGGAAIIQGSRAVASFDTPGTQLVSPVGPIGGPVQFACVTGGTVDFSVGHRVAAAGVAAPEFAHAAWLVFGGTLAAGDKTALATMFGAGSYGDWAMMMAHRGSTTAALQLVTAGGVASTIDWGDGTVDTPASNAIQPHSYASASISYPIRIRASAAIQQLTSSSNMFAFDVAALPPTLAVFTVSGSNVVTGSIANLPPGLTYCYLSGANTLSGSIARLPSGLQNLYVLGANMISGSIASLPPTLGVLSVAGANTISGSTASLPEALSFLSVQGANGITTAATPWRTSSMSSVVLTGGALTSAGVDNLLIALGNVTSWIGSRSVDLRGNNAPRTVAANAAVATITGLGATVLTN